MLKKRYIHFFILFLVLFSVSVYSATTKIKIVSPADTEGNNSIDTQIITGETTILEVWLETDTYVNGVGIYLTYNSDSVNLIDVGGDSFPASNVGIQSIEDHTSFGDIFYNRGIDNDVSANSDTIVYASITSSDSFTGNVRIAMLTFNAIEIGTTTIGFSFSDNENKQTVITSAYTGQDILTSYDSGIIVVTVSSPIIETVSITSDSSEYLHLSNTSFDTNNNDTIWFNNNTDISETITVTYTGSNFDSMTGTGNFGQSQKIDTITSDGLTLFYPIGTSYGDTDILIELYNTSNLLDTVMVYMRQDINPPAHPSLTNPSNNLVTGDTQITFQWGLSTDTQSGLDYYTIQISSNSSFTGLIVNDTTTSDSYEYTITTGTFYWRVFSVDKVLNSNVNNVETYTLTVDTEVPRITDIRLITNLSQYLYYDTDLNDVEDTIYFTSNIGNNVIECTITVDVDDNNPDFVVGDSIFNPIQVYDNTVSDSFILVYYINSTFITDTYLYMVVTDTSGYTDTSRLNFIADITSPSNITQSEPIDTAGYNITNIFFDWTDSSDTQTGFSYYDIQVSTQLDFSIIVNDTTTESMDTLTLTSETLYYWRVVMYDNVSNYCTSNIQTFHIDITGPDTPLLNSPADSTLDNDTVYTFIWGTVNDSGYLDEINYYYQISTDSTFASVLYSETNSSNSITLDTYPLFQNTYYWRVLAVDDLNNMSGWSDYFTLNIDTTINVSLINPYDTYISNDTTPVFQWTGDGDTYFFQVSDTSGFTTFLYNVTTDSTYYYLTTHLYMDTYYWRVGTIDDAGNVDTTSVYDFYIDTEVNVNLSTPPDNMFTGETIPTFTWTGDADTYVFYLSTDTLFTSMTDSALLSGTTSFTVTVSLSSDEYYWRVYAVDFVGNEDTTDYRKIAVDTNIPVITRVTLTTTNEDYIYYGSSLNTYEDTIFFNNIIATTFECTFVVTVYDNDSNTVTGNSVLTPVIISDTTDNDSYIIVYHFDSNVSTNTDVIIVTTDSTGYTDTATYHFVRDIVSPAGLTNSIPIDTAGLSYNEIAFNWTDGSDTLSGIDYYMIQVSTSVSFNTLISETVTQSEDTLTLSSDTLYYWRIITYDNVNNVDTGSISTFHIDINVPDTPDLTSPADNSYSNDTVTTFIWAEISDSGYVELISYYFELTDDTDFSSILYSGTIGTNTLYLDTYTLTEQTYYWRVKAIDDVNNVSGWSDSNTVIIDTTISISSNLPTDSFTTNDSYTYFNWTGDGDTYILTVSTLNDFTSLYYNVTTDSTYYYPSSYMYMDTYYWRVTALDAAGNQDTTSVYVLYIDTSITVNLNTPADEYNTNDTTPTFTWTGDGDTYIFYIGSDVTFSSIVYSDVLTGTESHTITQTLYQDTYYWRVSALDIAGNQDTTAYRTIYIDTEISVTLTSPANGNYSGDTEITFTWSGTSDTYILMVSDSTSFTNLLINNTLVSDTFQWGFSSDTYYWRVSGYDNAGNQDTTSVYYFSIDTTPISISNDFPSDNKYTSDTQPIFSWTSNGDSFLLEISTSPTFDTILYSEPNITTNSYTYPGYLYADTYYWRVIGYLNTGLFDTSSYHTLVIDTLFTPIIIDTQVLNSSSQSLNITISDRDANIDSNSKDTVAIRLFSDLDPTGIWIEFEETSNNSGKFTFNANVDTELNFSKYLSDDDANTIKIMNQNNITVQYTDNNQKSYQIEYKYQTTLSGTVTISTAEIQSYQDTFTIELFDSDADTQYLSAETIYINIYSTSDETGLIIPVSQTSNVSDTFNLSTVIRLSDEKRANFLKVLPGDSIYVEYTDNDSVIKSDTLYFQPSSAVITINKSNIYSYDDDFSITIHDKDMNIYDDNLDIISAVYYSSSDTNGISIDLIEDGLNSGTFVVTGIGISHMQDTSSVYCINGDTLYIVYYDTPNIVQTKTLNFVSTIPDSFALNFFDTEIIAKRQSGFQLQSMDRAGNVTTGFDSPVEYSISYGTLSKYESDTFVSGLAEDTLLIYSGGTVQFIIQFRNIYDTKTLYINNLSRFKYISMQLINYDTGHTVKIVLKDQFNENIEIFDGDDMKSYIESNIAMVTKINDTYVVSADITKKYDNVFKLQLEGYLQSIGETLTNYKVPINPVYENSILSDEGVYVGIPANTFDTDSVTVVINDIDEDTSLFDKVIEADKILESQIAIVPYHNIVNGKDINNGLFIFNAEYPDGTIYDKEFRKRVLIMIPYADSIVIPDEYDNNTNTELVESTLKCYTLDEDFNKWKYVETSSIDKDQKYVKASVKHFSVYTILGSPNISNLEQTRSYKNPFIPEDQNYRVTINTFTSGLTEMNVTIYNLAGEKIKELTDINLDQGIAYWDGKNKDTQDVASGLYIYFVKTNLGNFVGKMTVIRK